MVTKQTGSVLPVKGDWDSHLLVVFSILATFTLDKSFEDITMVNFSPAILVLTAGVFFILFENWYYLHKDFGIFNVTTAHEVFFYLASIICWCFLPYLYGKKALGLSEQIDPADWLVFNYLLILFFDSIRRIITVRKISLNSENALSNSEKTLLGEYAFYSITGFAYLIIILIGELLLLAEIPMSLSKSIIVLSIWGLIRTSDRLIIPRVTDTMASIFIR